MKRLFILLLLCFLCLLTPKSSYAEVIHNFDFNITAHKDGTMSVKEVINYDFESIYRHGIFRDIPLFVKVGDLYRI